MHLEEFADPEAYTLSIDKAAEFLRQIERIWSPNKVAFGGWASGARYSILSNASGNHVSRRHRRPRDCTNQTL